MTQREHNALVLGLGALVAVVATLIAVFGIQPEEVGLGGSTVTVPATDTFEPTREIRTQPPFPTATEPPHCEITVGQNSISEHPVPVYGTPEVQLLLGYLYPGDVAYIDGVYAVAGGIWAHVVTPVAGFAESQPGFYILEYPECAALLVAESTVQPIPTPTAGDTPTPLVVGCAVANGATYPLNLRLGASIQTPLAGQLQPGKAVDVVSGTRDGWLRVVYNDKEVSLAGWLSALIWSASCEGVIK